MLSLLRQRLGAPHTLSKAAVTNSYLLSTRRSFLTSIPRYEPAAAAPKKTAAAKAKGKDTAKKPVAKKVEEPTRLKLTQADMPPKHPGTAYIIFYTKYIKGLSDVHKPKSLGDIGALAKDASSMWRSFTEAEKQPFVDDYQRARALYAIKHQTWLENVPSETLAEINRQKVAQGKRIIRAPLPEVVRKRPLTSFFRYIGDFRKSAEAEEIRRTTTERNPHLQISKAAGEKWRAMDADTKAPYTEAAKKEQDAFNQAEAANDREGYQP